MVVVVVVVVGRQWGGEGGRGLISGHHTSDCGVCACDATSVMLVGKGGLEMPRLLSYRACACFASPSAGIVHTGPVAFLLARWLLV